jgi:hypothetical protein
VFCDPARPHATGLRGEACHQLLTVAKSASALSLHRAILYVFDGGPHYGTRWILNGIVPRANRTKLERGLPFELAIPLFDGPTIERVEDGLSFGELRIRALGMVGGVTLHLRLYPTRRGAQIISLRYANRKERDAYRATYSG